MVGLALVAVFAVSAIAVASASALEVLLVLEGGGVITPKSVTYTSKSEPGVTQTLQTVKPGSKIVCLTEENRGTITGPKTSESVVTFTGCESSVSGKKCQSGTASGEIITTVDTKLGIVKASNEEYGVLVSPNPVSKFECGAAFKQEVRGSAILSILKLNGGTVALNTPFLTWDISGKQTKGVQSILKFEGEGNQLLEDSENSGAFEMSGEEIEVLETFSKKVELSSTK
jgi:hypothetical protein